MENGFDIVLLPEGVIRRWIEKVNPWSRIRCIKSIDKLKVDLQVR